MGNKFYTAADAKGDLAKCHILTREIACHTDSGGVCPDCGGEAKILVQTAWKYKLLRDALGEAMDISSGNRCMAHQRRLWEAELARRKGDAKEARKHVAPPGGSPHNYAVALDIRKPARFRTSHEFADWIRSILGDDVRIGVYSWGCHIDCAHYLDPNPDPDDFHKGVHWEG